MKQESIAIPDVNAIKAEFSPIVARAEALEIATIEQHEGGLILLKDIRGGRKTIKGRIDPICQQADKLHKMTTGLRKDAIAPLDRAEAITTIYRPVAPGSKGYRSVSTTLSAYCWMHFSCRPAETSGLSLLAPTSCTALGTACRFISKSFGSEELLLADGEGKIGPAFHTGEGFV